MSENITIEIISSDGTKTTIEKVPVHSQEHFDYIVKYFKEKALKEEWKKVLEKIPNY
jgi:hypothetical protein